MQQSQAHNQPRFEHPHKVMLGLYIGAFLGMLSETSMNIALPDLCDAFNITTGTAQWMVVGYMLAIGVVLPCVGFLLKWVKAKTLVLFALVCFTVGSVLSAFAPVFALVLAGRIIQGIGTGIVLPTMYAAIMRVFPPFMIGAANGVAGLVIMFAPVIGPTLSGVLIGAFSWRAIFVLFAVVAVVAIVCTAAFFVTPIETTRPKVDVISVVASVIGFGCLVAGVSLVADMGFNALVVALLVIGIVVVAFYAYRQLHIEHPVLELRALGIEAFRVPALMVTCSFACTLALMFLAPQELQRGLGLDSSTAGMLMLAGGVVNAIFSFATGRMYDKVGARPLVRCGAVVAVIGSLPRYRRYHRSGVLRAGACGVHDRHSAHAAVRAVRGAEGPAARACRRRLHHPQHHAAGVRRDRHRRGHLPARHGLRLDRGGELRGRFPVRLCVRPGAGRDRLRALLLPEGGTRLP